MITFTYGGSASAAAPFAARVTVTNAAQLQGTGLPIFGAVATDLGSAAWRLRGKHVTTAEPDSAPPL